MNNQIMVLGSANFQLAGRQAKALKINLPGNTLVLFFINGDENCKAFDPVFKTLSSQDKRVNYAVVDISINRDIVMMSRSTNTPVNGIPHLILYINGSPHARFNATKSVDSMKSNITKALSNASGSGGEKNNNGISFMQPSATTSMGPAPGSAGFAPQRQKREFYQPDIGAHPTVSSVKGSGMNMSEAEIDAKLLLPDTVTPYNSPWTALMNGADYE